MDVFGKVSRWKGSGERCMLLGPGLPARMGSVFQLFNIEKRRTSLVYRGAKIDFELQGMPLNSSVREDTGKN